MNDVNNPKLVEKQWGWSMPEVVSPLCEVHRIDVRKGGFCSLHQHDRKHNVFTVVAGKLIIEFGADNPRPPVPLLPGQTYDVAPGIVHRFVCPEATTAIEVYYPASVDPLDIYRFSEGGVEP